MRTRTQPKNASMVSALSVEEFRARIDALLVEAAAELDRTRRISHAMRSAV